MDLARNLKKILKYMEEGFLEGLSSPSTKQKEKQTLRKQDNFSSTMSSQKDLRMEHQPFITATSLVDTSEKIIMESKTEDIVGCIRCWSISRINNLSYSHEEMDNSRAIYYEFKEWIDPSEDEIEILSINS